ncbi:MAG: GYF domain-containing protein [Myxococcales bacterium]|jgi:predicted Zn finger-like uncharacterized protein
MKIVCDSCGAKYSIADEKVAGKIFKIRCKKCSSVLEVRGEQTGAHPFEGTGQPQEQSAEAAWYIVVDGEQKGPLPPIQLSQLFAKGSVGLDSYVWREGFDDWKVAGDVPELAQIFGGAATKVKATAAVDDTSSFGTGRDLFGDGGREPTSEIEAGPGMFGSFDESPTPTDSKDSGSSIGSGAADSLGAMEAGLGAGMGAAGPQRMTGQRNENSVLFSLSNLQQLASGGGGAAASERVSVSSPNTATTSPRTGGEGSGLIDIRALAQSTTPGTKSAPSQSVDDLLALGAGGGGGLGAPLLGPAPLETSDGNRWLWIAAAAIAVIAIVGAGIGVGMALGGGEEDALEIAAAATTPAEAPAQVATRTPAAEAPAQPAEAEEALGEPEPAEPTEAATIEESAEATEPTSEPEAQRPKPRERRTSSPSRRQRAERPAPERQAPQRRSGGGNLDALMDEVVGGSAARSTSKQASRQPSSNSSLPESPSRGDVKTALQGVSGAVQACRKDQGGTATVSVVFSGKTGRATGARVASGPFKGTPVGSCIENAVKRARLPRFQQSTFKVTFPYRL